MSLERRVRDLERRDEPDGPPRVIVEAHGMLTERGLPVGREVLEDARVLLVRVEYVDSLPGERP